MGRWLSWCRGHNDAGASIDEYCHASMVENPWAALERNLALSERQQAAQKPANFAAQPRVNLGSVFAEELQVCDNTTALCPLAATPGFRTKVQAKHLEA